MAKRPNQLRYPLEQTTEGPPLMGGPFAQWLVMLDAVFFEPLTDSPPERILDGYQGIIFKKTGDRRRRIASSANKVLRGRCDAGETKDHPKAEGDGLRVPSGEPVGQNPRSRCCNNA